MQPVSGVRVYVYLCIPMMYKMLVMEAWKGCSQCYKALGETKTAEHREGENLLLRPHSPHCFRNQQVKGRQSHQCFHTFQKQDEVLLESKV